MWEIGGAWVQKNDVIAPNPGGTPVDFQFLEENDPTTTAVVGLFETEVALTDRNDAELELKQRVASVRPMIDLGIEAAMGRHWLTFAHFSFWSDSETTIFDGTAQIAYRLSSKWALSLGYRRVERRIDVAELFNEVNRNQIALGVWYFW